MRMTVLHSRDVKPVHWKRWGELQDRNPDLDSPYFSSEFVKIAGSLRKDVFVAVLGPPDDPFGFFPYQRGRCGAGHPVGSRLSDFHGLIADRGVTVDPDELLKACGLASWEFHALPASQETFASHLEKTRGSHFLDTLQGAPGYEHARRAEGSDQPRRLRSYRRKAQEKYRSVEFIPHVTDPQVLDTLLEWKSRQYQDSGAVDNWSIGWMRELIRRIHARQGEEFSGTLSALYFDGELAAAHMGMRSRQVWHWWIPRFSEKFAEMRPGLLLLYLMIEHAPRFGVRRIDLGYGDEEYKLRLRSGEIPVATGRVERPSFAARMRRWRAGLESWVRRSPLLPVARLPGRILKRLETWNRYR